MSAGSRRRAADSRGSSASDRALHSAAKNGRFVKAEGITGLITGLDDYHVVVQDDSGMTHLIHKSSPRISILPEQSVPFENFSSVDEESLPMLRKAAQPFKDWVMKHVYSQPI